MAGALTPVEFEKSFHRAAEVHERAWIFIASILMSVLLTGAMVLVALDYGVVVKTLPQQSARPTVARLPAAPGVLVPVGPKEFVTLVQAHLWSWLPKPLHIPQGSRVTFLVTSTDVLHGFEIKGTTINVMAIPGVIGSVSYVFSKARTYYIICNEFCGLEHQGMISEIIVDPST